jgi:predicted nucleic acid-binding protein
VEPDGFVVDTSALLTLIEDEIGAERVDQVLRTERVWIPWLVLLEVNYITRQERGEAEADRRYALMKQLPVTILWSMDEPTLLTAARIKASYHLSLADAVIAAFTMQLNANLLHKDPEFEVLASQLVMEALTYK